MIVNKKTVVIGKKTYRFSSYVQAYLFADAVLNCGL